MDFAKSALFKSYGVTNFSIGAAIYEVLFVFYSYPNAMTRKRRPLTALLLAMLHDCGPSRLSCDGKILVSVRDWLKDGSGNTRK